MRVEVALAIAAPVAVAAAWLLVRVRGVSVWSAMGVTLGGLGVLSLATGEPSAGPRPWLALTGGVLAGGGAPAATPAGPGGGGGGGGAGGGARGVGPGGGVRPGGVGPSLGGRGVGPPQMLVFPPIHGERG